MEEKRAKKRSATEASSTHDETLAASNGKSLQDDAGIQNIRRRFKQRKITLDADDTKHDSVQSTSVRTLKQEKVGKVLNKLFS
jgi:hypothetical protein